jgi:hypothetical protein
MPEAVKEWLSHLAAQGSITVNDPQLPITRGGTMSDASKRAKPDSEEARPKAVPTLSLSSGSYAATTPTTPWASSATEVVLPEGVSSLTEWGRTVCELPKYKAKHWSYSELAQNPDKEVQDYLAWICDHKHKAGRVADLANYLKASSWNVDRRGTYTVRIPGTSDRRRLKEA